MNNYINPDMYRQKVQQPTLLAFDEKRCFIIEVESIRWE